MRIFFVLFMLSGITLSSYSQYDAWVVVKLDKMTRAQLNAVQSEAQKSDVFSVEYECTEAGIVIVQYHGTSWSDPADYHTKIKELFSKHLQKGQKVEVLDVHVSKAVTSKC